MSQSRPRVVVAHGEVPPDAPEDERDALVEVASASEALRGLGYDPVAVPFSLHPGSSTEELRRIAPALVFNLVESLAGCGRYCYKPAELFERMGLPFTGSSSGALYVTTDKVLAKTVMARHGIPTPAWASVADVRDGFGDVAPPAIVKPTAEDASVGIHDGSVFRDRRDLRAAVTAMGVEERTTTFVEAYVDGRELNVSLLADGTGVRVLPPGEILFDCFPAGKPRIVGYEAKWDRDSFAYSHTPRSFAFTESDASMLARLSELALRCWEVFGLRGYARVDFRVDGSGRPWVIEVNANPCISPDSGFIAAARASGIASYRAIIGRIVAQALALDTHHGSSAAAASVPA